jgi:hypothetical protein
MRLGEVMLSANGRWAVRQLIEAAIYAVMIAWGLWMLGGDALRAAVIALVFGFMILSDIAHVRLRQLALLLFLLGLLVWIHIPAVDRVLDAAHR